MGAMVCVIAVAAGIVASFREAVLVRSGRQRQRSLFSQGTALLIAVGSVVMALVMIPGAIDRQNVFVVRFATGELVFGTAALLVFATRWRPLVEGLATISAGIFSFLSGFSIGFFTMWLALMLGLAAVIHSGQPESPRAGVNSG
jgi:hypothetical protein